MGDAGNHRGSLADDFETLLNSGFNADITLHAGHFKVLAHKTVLVARSPFFAAILRNGRPHCHLELHDVEADVLLQLVIFMYTDRIPKLQSMARKLLLAAEKLKLPVLEQKCKEQLALDMSKEQMPTNTVIGVCNPQKHQKRTSAVLDNTQIVQETNAKHCTAISTDTLQVAVERSSAKKMKLESCVQTPGSVSSVKIETSKIPVQSAERKQDFNGTSSKINTQTNNERSCSKGKSSPVPVHAMDSRPFLRVTSPLFLLKTTDKGSSPIAPIQVTELNENSSKLLVQGTDDRPCIQRFMAVLQLQPVDKPSFLNGKKRKIAPQAVNKRSHSNQKSQTVVVQPTDKRTCVSGKSPSVVVQPTDKRTCVSGKSPSVVVQPSDKRTFVSGKSPSVVVQPTDKRTCVSGKSPSVVVQPSDKRTCVSGKSPSVVVQPSDKRTFVSGKSPSVVVQPTDKTTCVSGKSPSVPVCVTDKGSILNGNLLTVPVQPVIEESHLNQKRPKIEVQTSEERVCVNGTSPKTPAKHRLSARGATVKSRNSTLGISTEKTKHSLHSAAEFGSLDDVETLLAQGVAVDTKDKKKRTALLLAAENGHEEVVKCLLHEGADIDAQDQDNWTPVHWATHNGHEEVVRCLLSSGADVSIRNRWQSTPLHSAAAWGHVNITHMLLSNSADANAKDKDGSTPLHCAAKWNQIEVAKVLLQAGAHKKAKDKKGKTPLDMVMKRKQNFWEEIMR